MAEETPRTMDEKYGDGSDHLICPKCDMCIDCGDCSCGIHKDDYDKQPK